METKALAEMTVGQIIQKLPGAIAILNLYLIDTCCGEHQSLALAAKDANASLDAILADLDRLEEAHA
ncbi:iron-sulfur cluster repair di-iron protein [compost metagenome]